MVPAVWIEHTTYRLQGGCSTAELSRHNDGLRESVKRFQTVAGHQGYSTLPASALLASPSCFLYASDWSNRLHRPCREPIMPRAARQTLTKTIVEGIALDPNKDVWGWDSVVR